MFDWIFGKNIESVINQTKKVKVCGVLFTIKKINMLDYLAGSRVLIQAFDTHKSAASGAAQPLVSEDKIKRHYADVLVAGVVYPELTHKKENENDKRILVDALLPNWELVDRLYTEIMTFTYGKKKLQHAISVAKNSSK